MTDDEKTALAALEQLLGLTSKSDWYLLHAVVRSDVANGKYSRAFEAAYKAMVESNGKLARL